MMDTQPDQAAIQERVVPTIKSGIPSVVSHGLFLLAVLGTLLWFHDYALVDTLTINFLSIVLEAIPFILLGALVSGFIEVFVSKEAIAGLFPESKWKAILFGAGLGLVFPVCECGIVPVVRRFLRKGLPVGPAIAFLLGGPIVNPIVASSTLVAYKLSWSVAISRMLLGFAVAFSVGWMMDRLYRGRDDLLKNNKDIDREGGHLAVHGQGESGQRFFAAVRHAADDFMDVARFLIIGAFVASLFQTVIPRSVFAQTAVVPFVSVAVMMVLAVVLNLCSEADAFVAASFRASGVPLSAQMAFMVLGPMLDVKLLVMQLNVFQKRGVLLLAGMTVVAVFLGVVIFGAVIG